MKDELWFKKQRLQDKIDDVVRRFEARESIKIQRIDFVRLGIDEACFCSRIQIEESIR